jgi:two-component system chemotaxis response regulator CheY
MRVLTIEDDPTAQALLKSILCKVADVKESTNGEEGLQSFCAALKDGKGFDLVCLDIGLPLSVLLPLQA